MAAGDLTATNPAYSKVPCASFDGVDDFISTPDKTNLDFTGNFSVSLWVKYTDTTDAAGIILHDNSNYKFLLYRTNGEGTLAFYVRTASGATPTSATADLSDNSWYHIVGSYDKNLGSSRIKIYVDGAQVGQADGYNEDMLDGDEGLYIGKWSTSEFKGFIRNVRVYDKTLSQAEITQLANDEDIRDGLVGHWALNGDATDSVYGNDGTVTGATFIEGSLREVKPDIDSLNFGATTDNLIVTHIPGRDRNFHVFGVERAAA